MENNQIHTMNQNNSSNGSGGGGISGSGSGSRRFFVGTTSFVRRFGQGIKTGLAIVGTATLVSVYVEYKRLNNNDNPKQENDDKGNKTKLEKKQQVLVIPFHRIQIVEKKDLNSLSTLQKSFKKASDDDDNDNIVVEAHELIDMIHNASQDPNIVALYGIFGHGGTGIEQLGWGNCEEIRNALRVFRESHRIHHQPNLQHQIQIIPKVRSKPMYAYSDTFTSAISSSNKEYYIASIFTDIHMQYNGELNLFGMITQNIFIRQLLEKYGIIIHVFKQGEYKNFPNMLTHSSYNQSHRDNVTNILDGINDEVCHDITSSRSKALLTSWLTPNKKDYNNWKKYSTTMTKSIDNNKNNGGSSKKSNNGNSNSSMNNSIGSKNNNVSSSITNDKMNFSWRIYQKDLWKKIQQSGTFPAYTAWQAGFIDYLPHRNPLYDLVAYNNKNNSKDSQDLSSNTSSGKEVVATTPVNDLSSNNIGGGGNSDSNIASNSNSVSSSWKLQETDFSKFTANEIITMKKYMKQIENEKYVKNKKEQYDAFAMKYPAIRPVLSKLGFLSLNALDDDTNNSNSKNGIDDKKKEKIALLHVDGAIGDDVARKLVYSIRKIRQDDTIKCIVLRVSSPGGSLFACETISQELKSLKVPIVVSFGDVAASGGYYISSYADRIFANYKTITGSIGVFSIRMDLSGLAKKYGINVQHVSTSDLAGTYNTFYPMTKKMKILLSDTTDRYYDQFKLIVSEGRNLSIDDVQYLARGRVYTGNEAKTNGLIDEIGGLHRAIIYAQHTYCTSSTSSDNAPIIERFPKQLALSERIIDIMNTNDDSKKNTAIQIWNITSEWVTETLFGTVNSNLDSKSVISSSINPDFITGGLIDTILRSTTSNKNINSSTNPMLHGNVLLLSDENSAIQFLLNESLSKQQQQQQPMYIPNSFWN